MPPDEPRTRSSSPPESPARPLSHWLQLMLAEIHAKREAHERGRDEDERRRAEAGDAARR